MSRLAIGVMLAASLAAAAQKSPVTRAELAGMEKAFNLGIERLDVDKPYDRLGFARGVYLEGFGAVFSAEVDLIGGPVLLMFRPAFTKEELEARRQKKIQRLPALKNKMRELMRNFAIALPLMPPQEQVAITVTLHCAPWENCQGLPSQIVMQAPKQKLMDSVTGRIGEKELDQAIRMEEF